jgi:formylglycine-generating enzyme required for sulfatase activity
MREEDIDYILGAVSDDERVFKERGRRGNSKVLVESFLLSLSAVLLLSLIPITNQESATFETWLGALATILANAFNPVEGLITPLSVSANVDGAEGVISVPAVLAAKAYATIFIGGILYRWLQVVSMLRQSISALPTAFNAAKERIRRIGKISPTKTVAALKDEYSSDIRSEDSCISILSVMSSICDRRATEFLLLQTKEEGSRPAVQAAAAAALGESIVDGCAFGSLKKDAVSVLTELYYETISVEVKAACVKAIGKVGYEPFSDELMALIDDRSTPIRLRDVATVSLNAIQSAHNIELERQVLENLMADKNFQHRGKNPEGCDRLLRRRDGAMMVLVPFGPFLRGSNLSEAERPQRTVFLPTYFIDEYPVTNFQFRKFVSDPGMKAVVRSAFGVKEGSDQGFEDLLNRTYEQDPDYPITGVPWSAAVAYARWALDLGAPFDKDRFETFGLPLESQWEKAARGPNGCVYPWGNSDLTPEKASYLGKRGFHSVYECELNRSPFGLQAMAGNAWEWCANWMHTDSWKQISMLYGILTPSETRVVRGGCWDGYDFYCRSNYRLYGRSFPKLSRIGFRVAYTPKASARILEGEFSKNLLQ